MTGFSAADWARAIVGALIAVPLVYVLLVIALVAGGAW